MLKRFLECLLTAPLSLDSLPAPLRFRFASLTLDPLMLCMAGTESELLSRTKYRKLRYSENVIRIPCDKIETHVMTGLQ